MKVAGYYTENEFNRLINDNFANADKRYLDR